GLSRQEIEIDLTRDQFEELWPATAGCRLTKTRYNVPFGKHPIEIDVYRGRNEGLVVAEVEFRDERECRLFQPPEWFAAEVSGKSRYRNVRLARGENDELSIATRSNIGRQSSADLPKASRGRAGNRPRREGGERYARARDAKTSEKSARSFADGIG